MEIGVVPQYKDLLDNNIFDDSEYSLLKTRGVDRPGFSALKTELEKRDHKINTIDELNYSDMDICIFHDINYHYLEEILDSNQDIILIYMMFEAPSYIPFNSGRSLLSHYPIFDRIITWNDDLVKKKDRICGFNLPYRRPENHFDQRKSFKQKTLITNISSRKHSDHPDELYSSRKNIIEYYDENHPEMFNLYGYGWDDVNRPKLIYNEGFNAEKFRTYQGLIDDKFEAYRKHKFSICFENQSNIPGWITEKIFDCFRAGTVPVYWGAENISDYIPKECFIDYRDFLSPSDLHKYLVNMDEKEYYGYLEAGQKYLKTSNEFTPTEFSTNIADILTSVTKKQSKEYGHLMNEIKRNARIDRILFDPSFMNKKQLWSNWMKIFRTSPKKIIQNPEITKNSIDYSIKK